MLPRESTLIAMAIGTISTASNISVSAAQVRSRQRLPIRTDSGAYFGSASRFPDQFKLWGENR